jgi:hypothetical protein
VSLGRSDLTTQPDATGTSFTWLGPIDTLHVDQTVEIRIDPANGGLWGDPPDGSTGPGGELWEDQWSLIKVSRLRHSRFLGRITDISPVLEGDIITSTITCVGRTASFGNLFGGDILWPQESEYARVSRIAAMVPAPFSLINNGNPGMTLAARQPQHATLLAILQEMAGWTAALVWEDGSGAIHYDGAPVRSNTPTGLTLAANEILDGVQWSQVSGRYVTGLSITYGTNDPQDVLVVGDGATPVVTSLATVTDAQYLADIILSRWGLANFYDIDELLTRAIICSPETWDQALSIQPGYVVETEGVGSAPGYPEGQSGRFFIEGWRETFDRSARGIPSHIIGFSVSDYDRFRVAPEAPTSVAVTSTPSGTTEYGTARTIAAVVTMYPQDGEPGPATAGKVSLYNGATRIGNPLTPDANGRVSWAIGGSVLNAGGVTLSARYVGVKGATSDSEGTVSFTVSKAATRSVLAVSSSAPVATTTVTLTATITNLNNSATVTGSVQFQYQRNGGAWTTSATKALNGGKATHTWTVSNPNDTWFWRVVFLTSANHNSSYSSAVSVNPVKGDTTCAFSAPSSVKSGNDATLSATVRGNASGTGTPTGTVEFQYYNAGEWITAATRTLDATGYCRYTWTSGVPSFTWTWRARYAGSSNFNADASASKTIDVY